jgi:carboxylesterase
MIDNSYFYSGGYRGVLLIHGLSGTPVEMKYVGQKLAAAGYTVYGMQLAGHCGTHGDLLKTGWRDWYQSVEQAFDLIAECCSQVFVVGLSMGAVLALRLAQCRSGEVAGVGLYSTTIWHDGWAVSKAHRLLPLARYMPFLTGISIRERPPFGIKDERIRKLIAKQMLSGDSSAAGLNGIPIGSLLEMRDLIARVKRNIKAMTAPALVLHPRDDNTSSIRNAEYLLRNLGGPVTMHILEDSYHLITVDRERKNVVLYSLDFFDAVVEANEAPPKVPCTANG